MALIETIQPLIILLSRFGSWSMAVCGETLAVPSSLWLGIRPTDIDKLKVGKENEGGKASNPFPVYL